MNIDLDEMIMAGSNFRNKLFQRKISIALNDFTIKRIDLLNTLTTDDGINFIE